MIFSITVQRFVVRLIQSVQYAGRMLWRFVTIVIGGPILWLWRLVKGTLRLLGRVLLYIFLSCCCV
ncbi:hypothetical protein ACFTAO_48200 [Paenibacillus rhizoplanae]